MLNPDGVILGNYRTGISGNDLNRQFISPDERLHPSIYALKELLEDIKKSQKGNIFAFIDFHGHSLKKNAFIYGSEYSLHNKNYYRIRILPKLISRMTEMFRYKACIFRINKSKIATSRAVLSNQFGITHFYTVEASYSSYLQHSRETALFNEKLFSELGATIGKALAQYDSLLEEEEQAKRIKMQRSIMERKNLKPEYEYDISLSSPDVKLKKESITSVNFADIKSTGYSESISINLATTPTGNLTNLISGGNSTPLAKSKKNLLKLDSCSNLTSIDQGPTPRRLVSRSRKEDSISASITNKNKSLVIGGIGMKSELEKINESDPKLKKSKSKSKRKFKSTNIQKKLNRKKSKILGEDDDLEDDELEINEILRVTNNLDYDYNNNK